MWPDVETDVDFINFSEVAWSAADLINNKRLLPLSLGIFGGWGAGKSSVLRLIAQEIDALEGSSGADKRRFLKIEFDAWLYQGYDDSRAALMEVIANKLIEAAGENKGVKDKAIGILRRVNYFRAIGSITEIGVSLALGIPPLGIAKRGVEAVGNMLNGKATQNDIDAIKADAKEVKELGDGLLKPVESSSPPKEITAFRNEFSEILNGLDLTLVVFIDNLDRCLPEVAIETLEAIRLFLFLPNTAFVIAADESMIRHAVSKHYGELQSRDVTDYLDKLIQVPILVPFLGVNEVRAYTMLLFISASEVEKKEIENVRKIICDTLSKGWSGETLSKDSILKSLTAPSAELQNQLDIADRLSPLLANAPNVSGNPRIVKRLLNTLRMRSAIAKRRKIQIDESLISKLLIFERCVTANGFVKLIDMVNESSDGRPKLIAELEAFDRSEGDIKEKFPEEWQSNAEFIESWLLLEPKLSNRDLRPALYLSRDTAPLAPPPGHLSPTATKTLEVLMAVKNLSSEVAKKTVKTLSPRERVDVMNAIIGNLKQNTDLKGNVPGFWGAMILADEGGAQTEQFVAYLSQLPSGSIGLGNITRLKSRSWAQNLSSLWAEFKKK